ncbi:MAG: hypothetical protein SOV29_01110 [Oscillospiraceae bacterium]|nr:hypothetical protein [Oscillospiraceae bacterium]
MKSSDLKVVAIILAIALFFTIVTSNAVSIASVVLLAKGGTAQTGGSQQGGSTQGGSTQGGDTQTGGSQQGGSSQGGSQQGDAQTGDFSQVVSDQGGDAQTGGSSQGGDKQTGGSSQGGSQQGGSQSAKKSAAEVLKAYTVVMDKAKSEKPGFTKLEYQTLPSGPNERVVSEGANLVGTLLNLVDSLGIMTTEDKAQPEVHAKGDDTKWFPVYQGQKGCYLTDANAIQDYSYEELSNGNVKITIVLKAEQNPEPISNGMSVPPSNTGCMFSPIAKKDIDNTINGGAVQAVVKNVNYSLNYHDCKAILEYNPKNNQIVKLEQYMNVAISGGGKIFGLKQITIDKQELYNTLIITDFKY